MGQQLRQQLERRPWLAAAVAAYLLLTAVELVRVALISRPAVGAAGLYEWELAPATPGSPLPERLRIEDGGAADAPAAPSDVVAFPLATDRVELTWTDESNDEQGFKLQRATPEGDWSSIWLGHDETSWVDESTRGGTHCYRIRSFNARGHSLYAYPSPPCVDAREPVPFRWTSAVSRLLEPIAGPVVTIPLYVARPDVAASGIRVVLSVNGRPIERLLLQEPGWHRISYYLPILLEGEPRGAARSAVPGAQRIASDGPVEAPDAAAEGGFQELGPWRRQDGPPSARFGIEVEPTFVPAAGLEGSRDSRRLGVGLARLLWSRAPQPPGIGFHDWERFVDGRRFRWTRRQASVLLEAAGPIAVFSLRADNPDIGERPLDVDVFWNDQLVGEVTLREHSWAETEFALGTSAGDQGVLSVRVGRTWIPAQTGASADRRVLGAAMTEVGWR